MGQSLSQIYLHIVFSTKDRRPLLQETKVREAMHNYLKGICKKQDCAWLAIGGVEDHVHSARRTSRR